MHGGADVQHDQPLKGPHPMPLRFAQLLIGLVVIALGSHSRAASFDCAKAATRPERMICSNQELSGMDDQLGALYARISRQTDAPGPMRAEQRRWLRERDQCRTPDCLVAAYSSRIADLEIVEASAKPARPETQSCLQSRGAAQARTLVRQCIQVSPASRPPCNDANPCDLIIDEIGRGCAMLTTAVPQFCRLYAR